MRKGIIQLLIPIIIIAMFLVVVVLYFQEETETLKIYDGTPFQVAQSCPFNDLKDENGLIITCTSQDDCKDFFISQGVNQEFIDSLYINCEDNKCSFRKQECSLEVGKSQ